MNDDQMAMMQKWVAAGTPGEPHSALDFLIGEFTSEIRFRQAADGQWQTMAARDHNEWILGGRFVRMRVSTDPIPGMNFKFEGEALFGYSNLENRYMAIWADTGITTIMSASGQLDNGILTLKGTFHHGMFGPDWPIHREYEATETGYVARFYEPGSNGSTYQQGEIVATRV